MAESSVAPMVGCWVEKKVVPKVFQWAGLKVAW